MEESYEFQLIQLRGRARLWELTILRIENAIQTYVETVVANKKMENVCTQGELYL